MNYSQKIITSILVIAASGSMATQAFAESDPFYQALSRTQEQEDSRAARELEILSRQLQKRGDLANAYRSQAASLLIRYHLDPYQYATPSTYADGTQHYSQPKWYHLTSCWSNDRDGFAGGSCEFGVGWMEPPTNSKNFSGIVILNNSLVNSDSMGRTRGMLDMVVVPKLKANESVVSSCETTNSAGKKQGVLALATYNSKLDKFTEIRKAWYPDLQAKRLKSIDPKQVSCPAPYDPEG